MEVLRLDVQCFVWLMTVMIDVMNILDGMMGRLFPAVNEILGLRNELF